VQGSGFPGSGGPKGAPEEPSRGPPEPTHWLTVAADAAPGPLIAMLLVIDTLHVIVAPPPLPELLHCRTEVTRSLEVVGIPPFSVTDEPVVPGLLVKLLMITTSQVVVSPGVSLMPLHCPTDTFAADAGPERTSATPPPIASATMPAVANLSEWRLPNVFVNMQNTVHEFHEINNIYLWLWPGDEGRQARIVPGRAPPGAELQRPDGARATAKSRSDGRNRLTRAGAIPRLPSVQHR